MDKASELFRKRLNEALEPRGAVADFCRKTDFARNTVEGWLAGTASPSIRNLEVAAEALNTDPWELIKPEDTAAPKPQLIDLLRVLTSVDNPEVLGSFIEGSLDLARGMKLLPAKLKQGKAHSP